MEFVILSIVGGLIFMLSFVQENWGQFLTGILGIAASVISVIMGYRFGQEKLSKEHTRIFGEHSTLTERISGERKALSGEHNTLTEKISGECKTLLTAVNDIKGDAQYLRDAVNSTKGNEKGLQQTELDIVKTAEHISALAALLGEQKQEILGLKEEIWKLKVENTGLKKEKEQTETERNKLQSEWDLLLDTLDKGGIRVYMEGTNKCTIHIENRERNNEEEENDEEEYERF